MRQFWGSLLNVESQLIMSSTIVLPGDGGHRYQEVALSGCPLPVTTQRGWHSSQRGSPFPCSSGGSPSASGNPFWGKKNNTWDEKRLVPGTSRSTVHLEQPCKHAGSSVRWVTVMDRRKSSATAASEQTALVIRLEM